MIETTSLGSRVVGAIEGLDVEVLRTEIRKEYEQVAANPDQGFHFHTGRPLARILQYEDAWLETIPEPTIASFAGTGNPFRMGLPARGADGRADWPGRRRRYDGGHARPCAVERP